MSTECGQDYLQTTPVILSLPKDLHEAKDARTGACIPFVRKGQGTFTEDILTVTEILQLRSEKPPELRSG